MRVIKQGAMIAELSRAKRASGAPWVRKFGKLSIRENLVMTYSTNDRPYTHYMLADAKCQVILAGTLMATRVL